MSLSSSLLSAEVGATAHEGSCSGEGLRRRGGARPSPTTIWVPCSSMDEASITAAGDLCGSGVDCGSEGDAIVSGRRGC